MATLYDYVAGLTVDGSSLVWSDKPLQKSQIDSANGNPYVYVRELDERPIRRMYGNVNVLHEYVDLQIFQAPDFEGRAPSRHDAMQLYFDILDAPNNVDEWIYGQPLIAMHHEFSMPPTYDDDSGGLSGIVRFRLLFPRG